jgi:histidyl-tRNA synthetase
MTKNQKASEKKDSNKNLTVQKVKGFRDILGQEYFRQKGAIEKCEDVALYYGFSPLEIPMVEFTDIFERGVGEETDIVSKELFSMTTKGGDRISMRPEFTAGVMRAYIENGWASNPQPIMVYNYGPVFRHDRPQKGRYREFKQFNVEMLGTEKPIADAMVIKTSVAMLEEIGLENVTVQINSIGDRESRKKFIKDLTNYYRKFTNKLCVNCRDRLKNSPLRLLDCKEESCAPYKKDAPRPMNSLNPESKKHFKEVLEYLEGTGVNYELNHHLVRGLDYYTHTVFEFERTFTEEKELPNGNIETTEKTLSIGGGGRYDYLGKIMGSRKDVPAVGVALGIDRILLMPGAENVQSKVQKKPKVFFVQIGLEAKLHSLTIVEMLRKARVPMAQSLSKDSLGVQLGMAERLEVPYVIIFGQKEAMDGVVIVRNMKNHSQETVKINDVAEYIKKLK